MTIWTDLLGARVRYYQGRYRTRVIEHGNGTPLILIHGFSGSAEAWAKNVVRLGEHFHVMAVDLLWHGLSECPDELDPVEYPWRFVDQVVDLLDQLGVERGHIEGESLGGWVALAAGLRHPDRVGKLVLNTLAGVRYGPEAGVVFDPKQVEQLKQRSLDALADPTPEAVRKRLEWLFATPDRVTDELVAVRRAFFSIPEVNRSLLTITTEGLGMGTDAVQFFSEEQASKLSRPTLVLWTDKNPGFGPRAGRRLHELVPSSEFYLMEDAAHWPQWEHPEEHDRVVAEFLLKD